MRRQLGGLGRQDVDDSQRVQRGKSRPRSRRVRKRRCRVAADDEQRLHVARFDLAEQPGAGPLVEAPRQLGTARRAGTRRPIRYGERAGVELQQVAGVEPHAAGLVIRVRHHVQRPQQPLGNVRRTAHRHAGSGERADPPVPAHCRDQIVESFPGDPRSAGRDVRAQRLERRPQLGDAGRSSVQGVIRRRTRLRQQSPDQMCQHQPVAARLRRQVPIRDARGLRLPRIDHPDLTSAGPMMAQPPQRRRHRVRMAMGDDGIAADQHQQGGALVVPDRGEARPTADELGDQRLGRRVDRRRRVLLLRAQHAQESLGRPSPRAVEGRPAGQVHRHTVRAVNVERRLHARREIVEHHVPADLAATDRGPVQAPGVVMEGG